MKRTLAVLLAVSTLIGLAACATPNPSGTTTIVPQTDKLR